MLFGNFSDLVDKYATTREREFKKKVADQIKFLKIKPKQYDDVFDFSSFTKGLDWTIDLTNLIKMFRKGDGSLDKAIAFYFLFHNEEPFFPAAFNIDSFLFGEGVTFEQKFDRPEMGMLPSFTQKPEEKVDPQRSAPIEYKVQSTPTDVILKISELMNSDRELSSFVCKLDYQNSPEAFRFDAKTFPHSDDEHCLDQILFQLSIVGGILRREELAVEDILWMRSIVETTLGNIEVHKYLKWLQSEEQIPGHADFCDAIYLLHHLTNDAIPALENYLANAEEFSNC